MSTESVTVMDRVNQIRGDTLNPDQQKKLASRIAEMSAAALSLSMTGSPAEVSSAIGQFQFMRGKIDAYQELLSDHADALAEIEDAKTSNHPSN